MQPISAYTCVGKGSSVFFSTSNQTPLLLLELDNRLGKACEWLLAKEYQ